VIEQRPYALASVMWYFTALHKKSMTLLFSAPPLRSLRLCGELIAEVVNRRDAENAEVAQRNQ